MVYRIAAGLSFVGLALLVWSGRSPGPQSEPWFDGVGAGPLANLRVRDLTAAARGPQTQGTRTESLLRRGLDVGTNDRPQRFRSTFRQLPERRDPAVEKDPQFQKLIEMDAARKMALVKSHDDEELKQMLMAQKGQSARIARHVLESALVDPNAEVRLAALAEISVEIDPPPLDLLAPVVEGDPDAEVRLEALEMVGESHSDDAVAVIRSALNDPEPTIRAAAEDLLEERDDEATM